MPNYTSALSTPFQPESLRKYQTTVLNTVIKVQSDLGCLPRLVSEDDLPKEVDEGRYEYLANKFKHETAGFVAAWREQLPKDLRPYGYLGMTSSNLIDCSMALAARQVTVNLMYYARTATQPTVRVAWDKLFGRVREGRTHGQTAAPVRRNAVYEAFSARLDYVLNALGESVPPGALRGPVGEPDKRVLPDSVQQVVSSRLNIRLDRNATQIANRQEWLAWAFQLYQLIGVCEQLATHHRLESLSGIERFSEKFEEGTQKGSSSMPHKHNPIRSERICGLARVARGSFIALMETFTSSWWERDLTNSSVEKIALTQLVDLAGFILTETTEVLITAHHDLTEVTPSAEWWSHSRLVESQLNGINPDDGEYYNLQKETNGAKDSEV